MSWQERREPLPNTARSRDDPWWETAPLADVLAPLSAQGPSETPRNPFGRVGAAGAVRRAGGQVPQGVAVQTCKVPGCERKLHRANRLGLCRWHNHAVGYCDCPKCAWRAG